MMFWASAFWETVGTRPLLCRMSCRSWLPVEVKVSEEPVGRGLVVDITGSWCTVLDLLAVPVNKLLGFL